MNILRRRRVVLALLVLILGCKLGRQAEAKPPNPPPGYMAIPSPAAAQPNAAPVLEREALALAASHWNGLYILCGDDRFTQRFVEHGHGDIYGYQWMTEYKGVSWVILPGEVTEADRLNGIEWQGTSEVHGIATRRQLRNQGWQPWQQFSKYLPMGRISLTKSGGQWHIQQEAGGYDDGETVALSCGDQRQLSDPQQQAAAIRGEQAAQQTFVAHWQTSNGNVELTNSKWTNNSRNSLKFG